MDINNQVLYKIIKLYSNESFIQQKVLTGYISTTTKQDYKRNISSSLMYRQKGWSCSGWIGIL